MPVRSKRPVHGAGQRGWVVLAGTVTIGAAGAVSALAGDCTKTTAGDSSVIKTATEVGRYTVTLDRKYRRIIPLGVTLEGPADAALGNTDANLCSVRVVGTQSLLLQLSLASSGADTETTSGNKVHWAVLAQEI
jgi:hypothetical protein